MKKRFDPYTCQGKIVIFAPPPVKIATGVMKYSIHAINIDNSFADHL